MKTKNLMRLIFGLGLSGMFYLVSGYDQAGLVLCIASGLLTLNATSFKNLCYKNIGIRFVLYLSLAEGLLSSQPFVSSAFHFAIVVFVMMGVLLVEILDNAKPRKKMQMLAQFDVLVLLCVFLFCLLLVFPLSILQWFQHPLYQGTSRSTFLVVPLLFFFPIVSVECTLFYRKMKEMLRNEKSIQQV